MWMGMRRVREGVGGIKLIGRKDLFVFEGAGISCSIFFLGVYCVSRWKQG